MWPVQQVFGVLAQSLHSDCTQDSMLKETHVAAADVLTQNVDFWGFPKASCATHNGQTIRQQLAMITPLTRTHDTTIPDWF